VPRIPIGRSTASPDALVLVSLGVLILASVALATYTTSVQERGDDLRAEAARISPAVRASQELIVAVSVEEELHGRAATAGERERNVGIRRGAIAVLDSVTRELGGNARAVYLDLSGSLREWETLETSAAPSASPTNGPSDGAVQPLFRTILRDGTELQRVLYAELEQRRADVDSAERLDWYYTLGLVLVALTASVVISLLVNRIRYLGQVSEQRRVEAEAAVADRARLIRGITHDLKNPLGAADGNAQLLEMGIGGELTAEQGERIKRIRRTIGSAVAIVSDLLELSRAEAESLHIERAPTELGPLLQEVVEDYRSQVEASGITLRGEVPPDLPACDTDARRVRQILSNLLSNAIKFTPPGGHIVLAAVVAGSRQEQRVEIRVSDTGPGIRPEEQDRIFEEFFRGGDPVTRPAGSGLGLTISRRLARLLGGDLVLKSAPGKGATFQLSVPVR
jgi:signal transduction histidine kinase